MTSFIELANLSGKTALVCAAPDFFRRPQALDVMKSVARILASRGSSVALAASEYEPIASAAREIKKEFRSPCEALEADLRDDAESRALGAAVAETMGGLSLIIAIDPFEGDYFYVTPSLPLILETALLEKISPDAIIALLLARGEGDEERFRRLCERAGDANADARVNALAAEPERRLSERELTDALIGPLTFLASDLSRGISAQYLKLLVR